MTDKRETAPRRSRRARPRAARRTGLILVATPDRIESCIVFLRGEKVMLDVHLAALYGVTTRALNQAVRRNSDRFPADFMFQLTPGEYASMRSQFVITSRRGLARLPLAFTEHGVAMLSSILRSPRAVQVNIEIMRAFVRLRSILASHTRLARRLSALEKKYDAQFKVVFDAIRGLMAQPDRARPPIGFRPV